jgi:DNA-binding response OmpR family regulator
MSEENGTSDSNPRILIIEDDAAVARSLHEGLVREGYTVQICDSGGKGIEAVQKTQPHLIFGYPPPRRFGFDFCRQIANPACTSDSDPDRARRSHR